MGLLDGNLDPQTAGALALAGGLLSPGSFGQGLSRGIAGQQSVLMNDQDMQLKRQQVMAAQQEQAIRAQQMRLMQMKMDDAASFMSGTPSAPSSSPLFAQGTSAMGAANAAGSIPGPTNAAAALQQSLPAPQAAASRISSVSPDEAAARLQLGIWNKETYELWKSSKEGMPFQPGYRAFPDGRVQYNGDPTKGITMDGDTVVPMAGAASTLSGLAAATTTANKRAENAQTPVPIDRLDRQAQGGPLTLSSSVDDLLNPPPPALGGPLSAQPKPMQAAILRDMQKYGPGTVNGQPINAAPSATAPASGGFKTQAQLAAENLRATQDVHATTDPLVKFNTDRLVGAHTAVQAVYDKLSDTVRNEAELQNRNNQLYPLLNKIQTGGFAPEQRIQFANALQTAGWVPDALKGKFAEWVAGGDPTTGKVIENQLAAAGIKTMLDTLDKEGKPNRAIFQAIQAAQESAKSGNATLKQVFDLQKQLYNWHYQQEQDLGTKIAAPDYNPITTLRDFSARRNDSLKSAAPATPTMRWNAQTGKIEAIK